MRSEKLELKAILKVLESINRKLAEQKKQYKDFKIDVKDLILTAIDGKL